MGGSDQWGNIVNGVELGRRSADMSLYGLTCPLLMTASGQKMGKTASGAVWLNEDLLPTYDYWQYWRNCEDAEAAADTAKKAFEQGSFGGALPVVKVERARLDAGIEAFALVLEAGLAKSGGEARRHIRGNAIKLNDAVVTVETQRISASDLGSDGRLRLSFGKKQHVLIEAA
jgi:tyrosyl-tRNA synthetase